MSNLSAFLKENVQNVENLKHKVSNRFKDENGEVMAWELTCITSGQDEKLRDSCTKLVKGSNKNLSRTEVDYSLYLGKLAVMCTVYPNLNDKELQDSYGVMGADTLLKSMLLPGEYADYLSKIQEINGFENLFEEKVDEAKN